MGALQIIFSFSLVLAAEEEISPAISEALEKVLHLEEGDEIHLNVTEDQIRQTIPVENWAPPKAAPAESEAQLATNEGRDGHCLGITCINTALITDRIEFKKSDAEGKVDSNEKILEKLMIASAQHGVTAPTYVSIYGFESKSDFISKMKESWGNSENPLKQSIINLQKNANTSKNFAITTDLNAGIFATAGNTNVIFERLSLGLPVYIVSRESVFDKNGNLPSFAHIVMAIGSVYKQNTNERYLLILDSNYPQKIRIKSVEFLDGQAFLRDMPTKNNTLPTPEYFWMHFQRIGNIELFTNVTSRLRERVHIVKNKEKEKAQETLKILDSVQKNKCSNP